MKTIKIFAFITALLYLASCSTTENFPVSTVTPAAEIAVSKKMDKHNNYMVEVTSKYLASADRLKPSKSNYSVWIITAKNETKNLGQLIVQNGKSASFKTLTPYEPKEIFITAEDEGNNTYPSGVEISRVKFD